MPEERWEFLIIFLLGLFVGYMLSQQMQRRPTPQSRKSSTTYTKTETGFLISEEVLYE